MGRREETDARTGPLPPYNVRYLNKVSSVKVPVDGGNDDEGRGETAAGASSCVCVSCGK